MARKARNRAGKSANRNGRNARSIGPLKSLKPYLLRHKPMVIGALVALVVAAFATLAVPIGVRRMIDAGFSASNSQTINSYFMAMFAVGLILALASAVRFYFVSWLGRANRCRSAHRCIQAPGDPKSGLLRCHPFGGGNVAPDS